jgi:hypothetical protein
MTETPRQLPLQTDTAEQRLEHNQPGERGQSLILKLDLGNAVGFTMNGGFATLHANGLRWLCWTVWYHQYYQLRDRFFMTENYFLSSIFHMFWIPLSVKSSNTVITPRRAFM